MNKKLFIYMFFAGIISMLVSCEKDGDKVIMMHTPEAPAISELPNLTLTRANGNNMLLFKGTPVNPGFRASANYFLEAAKAGTNFSNPVVIANSVRNDSIKISVSDLNSILLKKLPADQVSSVDFRFRTVLVVDAGTGAVGTTSDPLEYVSPTQTADVTVYGLPRLDLISNNAVTGKVESALGDGKYTGFVKFDKTKPYTLKDPDAGTVYGDNAGALKVNGTAITPSDNGWHRLTVDTKALTYKTEAYQIGLVGSATPNGWDSPDQKMDYDAATGTWKITITLKAGDIKFRLNDGWAWNMGGTPDKLTHDGANIAVAAGNYTITLTITNPTQGSETGTFTIVKNN